METVCFADSTAISCATASINPSVWLLIFDTMVLVFSHTVDSLIIIKAKIPILASMCCTVSIFSAKGKIVFLCSSFVVG